MKKNKGKVIEMVENDAIMFSHLLNNLKKDDELGFILNNRHFIVKLGDFS